MCICVCVFGDMPLLILNLVELRDELQTSLIVRERVKESFKLMLSN